MPERSPLEVQPRQARADARKKLESFMSVGDNDLLAEADMDDEDSEDSDNEENVHLLGSLYKITNRGVIVPLVGTTSIARSEDNLHMALKKVMSGKENKSCVECGCTPVKYISANLGVFLCATCQKFHQQLGVRHFTHK